MEPPVVPAHLGVTVARVVVDVMLKPEILDPQGRAVRGALQRLGLEGVADVRQGKRFEITLDGALDDERHALLDKLAEELLANPVIEDHRIRIDEGS
jgi:phosphoribosylformylglycinamidine synthase PurS subunit